MNTDASFLFPPVVTIREASQLHVSLLHQLQQNKSAILDCSTVEEADLSVIQLILAARLMADRDGLVCHIVIPSDGIVAELIRLSGLEHEFPEVWKS